MFHVKEGICQNPVIAAGTKYDEIKENVTKLWTDFAKWGHCGSEWPVADAAKGLPYVEITEKLVKKDNFYEAENKFWDEIHAFLSK